MLIATASRAPLRICLSWPPRPDRLRMQSLDRPQATGAGKAAPQAFGAECRLLWINPLLFHRKMTVMRLSRLAVPIERPLA